ncbi:MAG: hypothetical protein SFW09_14550 [Hyphomicrobiaceae bacterium]|nr:hypothetical protein [Hyphomicrobiaceae bacterium]
MTRSATGRVRHAAILLSAMLTAGSGGGCGMSSITSGIGGGMFGGGSASKADDRKVTHEQMLTAAKANSPMAVGGDMAGGCPRFAVWPRDHHVTIYEPGRSGDGLSVIHRGEITQTARECSIQGTRVTVKYGFSGRVLLGPKGRPGNVSLPVNVFVTDAKRARISNEKASVDVMVSLDKPIGYFSAVRTVTFEVPVGARAGEFEVFVGFDQQAPGAG